MSPEYDEPVDPRHLLKRRISAHAAALTGLAQFARYQTSLDHGLSTAELAKGQRDWFASAGDLILEQIKEFEPYPEQAQPADYTDADKFILGTGLLTLMELRRVIPLCRLAYLLAEVLPVDTLLNAAQIRAENPEAPENAKDDDDD